MTLAEFKTLSGIEMAETDYHNIVENVYYHIHNEFSDKAAFCPEFAKLWESPLFRELCNSFTIYERAARVDEKWRDEDARLILEKAHLYKDADLMDRAIFRLGKKEVLRTKIAKGWELTDEDRQELIEYIK